MLSNDLSMNNLIATWNTFLPNTFDYSHLDQVAQDAITSRINGFYFGNETTPTNQLDRNNLIHVSRRLIPITSNAKCFPFSCLPTDIWQF